MLERIISGGQTGADQAGLRAARAAGIATGGVAPLGWRTEAGPAPWLADWGLVEHPTADYPSRTRANYRLADGIILFGDPGSKGSRLLMSIQARSRGFKPLWLVCNRADRPTPADMVGYIPKYAIRTLMVAGNRESGAPGIGDWVEDYMAELLALLAADQPPSVAVWAKSEGEAGP